MPTLNGLDQSWGFADPATAAKAGIRVVSMYLSWDTSKNITASKVKRYHAVNIASLINWESQAGAPLLGARQGIADATEAVRLLKALIADVGYKPDGRLIIYFSCDRDITSANYGQIENYYRAAKPICAAAGFGIGVYGEADLCSHLSKLGVTDAEWQTYAWSGGRLDPTADFYQYHNGQKLGGASVDFDSIIHPAALGAWWAPGKPPTTSGDDEVTPADIAAIAKAVVNTPLAAIDGTKATLGAFVAQAETHARNADTQSKAAQVAAVDADKLLNDPKNGLVVRLAHAQAAIDALSKQLAALEAARSNVSVIGTLSIGGAA